MFPSTSLKWAVKTNSFQIQFTLNKDKQCGKVVENFFQIEKTKIQSTEHTHGAELAKGLHSVIKVLMSKSVMGLMKQCTCCTKY